MKSGQKIGQGPLPPSFGQKSERHLLFFGIPSLIQLHTGCLTAPPDFQYLNGKKVIQGGGDIDVLVSDTLGTQESRIGPETDLYLVHPSGDS